MLCSYHILAYPLGSSGSLTYISKYPGCSFEISINGSPGLKKEWAVIPLATRIKCVTERRHIKLYSMWAYKCVFMRRIVDVVPIDRHLSKLHIRRPKCRSVFLCKLSSCLHHSEHLPHATCGYSSLDFVLPESNLLNSIRSSRKCLSIPVRQRQTHVQERRDATPGNIPNKHAVRGTVVVGSTHW